MRTQYSLTGYDRPTSEWYHFPLCVFTLENISLLWLLSTFEDIYCCLTFRNSNRCDFISFSGAWRRTWLLSVSFSQSCPEKRQELSNSPSEEKWGYNYSRYWGNNCNFTAVKCQHPLSPPVALTDNRKVCQSGFIFSPFFSQVSPKVPDSGQFSSYPRKFPTD